MSNPTYNKLPLAALKEPPLPSREVVEKDLQEALTGFRRKLVVLDDDPTGVQTVHDVPVYTDWSKESLLSGLQEQGAVFFVLTNSRSFSAEKNPSGLSGDRRESGLGIGESTGAVFTDEPGGLYSAGTLSAGNGDSAGYTGKRAWLCL